MTEPEWLTATNPTPMLEFLQGKPSDRKARLLACAYTRAHPTFRTDPELRRAVALMERDADGEVPGNENVPTFDEDRNRLVWFVRLRVAHNAAYQITRHTSKELRGGIFGDIFSNPSHPVTCDPRWLTYTAVTLASGIYAERAFDRMPILADALEDAGCDSADILSHCRGDGPHVRGCWVVDLVLGKQ